MKDRALKKKIKGSYKNEQPSLWGKIRFLTEVLWHNKSLQQVYLPYCIYFRKLLKGTGFDSKKNKSLGEVRTGTLLLWE